ncbi:hypothetical protein [Methanopyrus sp.]
MCHIVQEDIKKCSDMCSNVISLLGKISANRRVDVSHEIHDIKLCKRYLSESYKVLDWSRSRLEELDGIIDKYDSIRERLLVEAMDGENGLLSGLSLLEDMRWNVQELSDRLSRLEAICRDFLEGKLGEDEFMRKMDEAVPDAVGYARSVRDSSYHFGSVVNASLCRVKEIVEAWEEKRSKEEEMKRVVASRFRKALMALIAALVLSLLPGWVQQYISTIIGLMTALMPFL